MPTSDRWVADVREPPSAVGARAEPLRIFGDLVVVLDDRRPPSAPQERARRPRRPRPLRSDAADLRRLRRRAGRPAAGAGRRSASTAFRLRPAVLPDDLDRIVDGVVPELQRRGRFRTALRTASAARAARAARPASRYAATPDGDRHERASRSSSAPTSRGVNNTTVWSDPRSGSQIDFESFEHLAQTAERGKFDFFFLAEGLRLREQRRAGSTTSTSSAAPTRSPCWPRWPAVTTHLGLAGTLNATFHEPYELARQLATLDQLSGRAGRVERGHVVGRLHRRELPPRRLPRPRRPLRAGARSSSRPSARCGTRGTATTSLADRTSGRFLRTARAGAFAHRGSQFDIRGHFNVPRSPQGHPVILQAGRQRRRARLAARSRRRHLHPRTATLPGPPVLPPTSRPALATYGRDRDELKILPAATLRARRHRGRGARDGTATSAASRSARRPRSSCWSSSGTATCRATTPTARCPTSTRT